MTEKEKLELLEDALEVDEGFLVSDMNLADIDEFNSMAVLALIVLLEDEFGKVVTGKEIKNCTTVADILTLMES